MTTAICDINPQSAPRAPNPERIGERGVVLGIVIITSIIFGIAAFGLLSYAVNQASQTNFVGEDRLRARYAAEAGLVIAMQELWSSPTHPCTFGPGYPIDTDNNGTADADVVVTATPCPAPGIVSKLMAKVTF